MAERKYITDENLKRFGTNVKLAIKASETTLDGKITNVANIANNGVAAAAGALAEAKKKIAKGALATINGQSLENGGEQEQDEPVEQPELVDKAIIRATEEVRRKTMELKALKQMYDKMYDKYDRLIVESESAEER